MPKLHHTGTGSSTGAGAGPSAPAGQVLARALSDLQAGRSAAAQTACEELLAREPGNPDALHLLGWLALQTGQRQRAVELIGRAAELRPENAGFFADLAVAQAGLGRDTEAIGSYRRVLMLQPEHALALGGLGSLYRKRGQLDDALDCFQRAVAVEPEVVTLHRNLGGLLRELSRTDEAAACLRRALEIEPEDPDLLKDLGRLEADLGRWSEALVCYRRVIDANPDDAEALNRIGGVHRSMGDIAAAVEAYERATEAHPDFAKAWSNLARMRLTAGQAQAALEAAETAVRLDPGGSCSALADQAAALHELGRSLEAQALLAYDRLVYVGRLEPPPGYRDLAAFNAELARAVRDHATLVYEPSTKTTRGGWQTGELFDGTEPFKSLELLVRGAIQTYMAGLPHDPQHPFLAQKLRQFRLTAWGVVLGSQGHQESHTHPSGWVSGVYYVSLPGGIGRDSADRSGWLEFGRCDRRFKLQRPPQTRAFRPEEGLVVLFPSFFWHRTIPFESDGRRISIAFDAFGQS